MLPWAIQRGKLTYEFTLGVVYWILQVLFQNYYTTIGFVYQLIHQGASFEKEGAQIGLVCKIDLICCRSGNFLR